MSERSEMSLLLQCKNNRTGFLSFGASTVVAAVAAADDGVTDAVRLFNVSIRICCLFPAANFRNLFKRLLYLLIMRINCFRVADGGGGKGVRG